MQHANIQHKLGLISTKEFLNRCSYTVSSYEESQRHLALNIQQADNQSDDTRDNEPLHQQDQSENVQLQNESDHSDHGKNKLLFLIIKNYNYL